MFLFFSDSHLTAGPQEGLLAKALTDALKQYPIKSLFFLGDIFEFWWGDDHHEPAYHQWEQFFASLNVDKYFIVGNRDFLVGTQFFKRAQITPLAAGSLLAIDGKYFALYHGDEQALNDKRYHYFKTLIRHRITKTLWLLLPHQIRRMLAQKGRRLSNSPLKLTYDYHLWLQSCSMLPSAIIHGHCHRESIITDQKTPIITLGDWNEKQSSLLLINDKGEPSFLTLPLSQKKTSWSKYYNGQKEAQ